MDRIEELKAEIKRLTAENERLRALLVQHGIAFEQPNAKDVAAQRLALYRSFFRGREDVYAQRWYNKAGKKQYSPKVKEAYTYHKKHEREAAIERGEEIYEPFDDEAVARHLKKDEGSEKHAYGIYLIVGEDECYIAAFDFDGERWREDITVVVETIEERGFPSLIELTQSGNGAHLWFFFEDAIKAKKARQFCSSLITLTMERYPLLTMQSYDRIFPSQDQVAIGGFGSLIALPLEGEARTQGRTVFLDRELEKLPDPWLVLQQQKKITEEEIDAFLASVGPSFDTGKMGMDGPKEVLPLFQHLDTVGETAMTKTVAVTLENGFAFPITGLPASLINELKRIASFKNPEFFKAQAMRLNTWDIPRIICSADLEDGVMTLPRGCREAALAAFGRSGIAVMLDDKRSRGEAIALSFAGELREEQQAVVDEMVRHECGVLSAPTGFGKTVAAAALLAELGCSALVIVHTVVLLRQWQQRLEQFLGLSCGLLGGGKNSLTSAVDIAVINTLRQEQYDELLARYGVVIVDECHRVAAVSYEQVLKRVRAQRVYGLTATPMRSDGHHDIIFMQCGPLIHRIDSRAWREKEELSTTVIARFTSFRCDYQRLGIQEVYEKLSRDEERNDLLVDDIQRYVQEGRSILVLSGRLEQLGTLQALLSKRGLESLLMSGSQSAKEKRRVAAYLDELKAMNSPALILSTGKYIGEGFDFPALDTLVLASPIAWKGSITQYVGRVSRRYEGKSEILVLDYVDFRIPVLTRMFAKRVKAFKKEGFAITQHGQQRDDELLYTRETYWPLLERDLREANGPILFSAQYVSPSRVQRLLPLLTELSASKQVTIRVPKGMASTLLKSNTITLQHTEEDLVNCILIAERILWYGSINIFGAIEETDTLLRIEDPTYASQVMRWLEGREPELL